MASIRQQRKDYWGADRDALVGVLSTKLVDMLQGNGGKQWWTIGELADLARCYCVVAIGDDYRADYSNMPRREQNTIMQRVVRMLLAAGQLDCVWGADDGREVRVYGLNEQAPQ